MKSRLEILRGRYERLIVLNQANGYTRSERASRYVRAIRTLKNQISAIESQNRDDNRNSCVSIFLNASKGMSGFQILMNAK